MVIQPYSSLFETPRIQLSREAYENSGLEIFSSEKIPFANRTGPAFAKNLVNMFINRVKSLQKKGQSFPDGIHIYELGAGNGILAKRILDLLKTNHKDTYGKVVLHLSDISEPMVAQLKALEAFKKHQDRVFFEVIDATRPKFTHKPLLVYFTNLIDSFPYRHILVKDKQIFEFQVQTSLKRGAQIIDVTSYPPKVLEEKEIAKVLSSSDIKRRLILAPQILTVLQEENNSLPIADVLNINQEELADLQNLAGFLKKTQPFTINYSYTARTVIRKMIQELEKGGFIFFSDFGITSDGYKQVLHVKYGVVIAFSVDFPSLTQAAETTGKTSLTSNAPGYPQEMLIDTLPNDKEMAGLFEKESMNDLPGQVTDFLKNAKAILSQGGQITRLYNYLPKEVRRDYLLLNSLALFLLQAKFYQEAATYADILLKNYGHTVGVICYLAKGKTEQEQGNPKAAEEFFKKATDTKEFLAYVYLGELYWQQERYGEYIKVIKEYLKYTRRGDYLKSIFLISRAEEKLYGTKTARKTLQEITRIGRMLKTISQSEKEFLKHSRAAVNLIS